MRKFVLLAVSMILIMSLAGCDLFMQKDVTEDYAIESRGVTSDDAVKGESSQFTATVRVFQIAADTYPVGAGDRWLTRDESFLTWDYFTMYAGISEEEQAMLLYYYGWDNLVVESDWDYIDGASIMMDNATNFSMVLNEYGAFDLSGVNHSDITLIKGGLPIMTFKANGDISGMFPVNGELSMKAKSVGESAYNVQGTLTGSLAWDNYYNPYDEEDLAAVGQFTLTGTYK